MTRGDGEKVKGEMAKRGKSEKGRVKKRQVEVET